MNFDDVVFTVSAPGKVILIGEHSVIYKKRGIAASINKRTFLQFREHKEAHDQITFNLINLEGKTEWDFKSVYNLAILDKPLICDIKEFSIASPELLKHEAFIDLISDFIDQKAIDKGPVQKAVLGIFYILLGMLWCTDINITPFDLEITTDLTIGAGTGSSASFSVCTAAAIYNYIRLKAVQKHGVGEFNISNIVFKPHIIKLNSHYCGFSSEEKDIINKWAFCVEKIMHGSPSGLDNTVCTFGNAVLINSEGQAQEKSDLQLIDNFPSFRVLLVNTGIPRSTSDLLKKVASLYKVCPEATNGLLDAMDVVAVQFTKHSHELKDLASKDDILLEYRKLETLIDIQHGLLCTLGVSHSRLDEVCTITKRRGLHSKLTGAGGGGYAYTLVPPDIPQEQVTECINDLKGAGFSVEDVMVNGEGLALDFK